MAHQPFSGADARAARISLELSQSSVAAEIGVNRTYLSLFESGRFNLADAELDALCGLYESHGFEFGDPRQPDRLSTGEPGGRLSALRDEIAALLSQTVDEGVIYA